MLELLNDPAVWASFFTLTILEIVLGVDNVIFISIAANRLPEHQRRLGRTVGLAGALLMRIALLFSIAWIVSLKADLFSVFGQSFSWRDLILLAGGFFLYGFDKVAGDGQRNVSFQKRNAHLAQGGFHVVLRQRTLFGQAVKDTREAFA